MDTKTSVLGFHFTLWVQKPKKIILQGSHLNQTKYLLVQLFLYLQKYKEFHYQIWKNIGLCDYNYLCKNIRYHVFNFLIVYFQLRLNTAPVIMHFPAKGKPKPADSMDFERAGIHAEAIAKWIQDRTDVQVNKNFKYFVWYFSKIVFSIDTTLKM